MTFQEIRDRANRVRGVPLEDVLLQTGAKRDPADHAKWHTGKGAISCTGMKFMNWNLMVGGGGAIDLAMHLNNLDFKVAVEWLWNRFPHLELREAPGASRETSLTLPGPAPGKLPAVKRYLADERAIPASLIQNLIDSGSLYADNRVNAVFLLLGKESSPVGAELRGTTAARWRGMAPGSQKDLGYFSVPATTHTTAIVLCESAIDAISCFALHPDRLCISTSGARHNPLWLPMLIRQRHEIYCGFDTDQTGEEIAAAMVALYPVVKRLRPSRHDWNDMLTAHYTLLSR
jgi:hypothetical protein